MKCIAADLSGKFEQEGMLAYVNEVQRREKAIGCDVLTHQKWFVYAYSVPTVFSH